jgi:hypothetical protein
MPIASVIRGSFKKKKMKNGKHITTIIILLFCLTSFGQKKSTDFLLAFKDKAGGKELWGFKTRKGKVVLSPKYEHVETDTMYHIAFVTRKFNWIVIDRQGKKILTPFIYDNGPDYVVEGLFRYQENKRIGFANMKGEKITKQPFEFAFPFSSGLAAFCVGGHIERVDEEHTIWTGGLWGFIDKTGKIVIEPKFTKVRNFQKQYCEVWTKDKKHVLIDKKGNIYKLLTK